MTTVHIYLYSPQGQQRQQTDRHTNTLQQTQLENKIE